MLDNNKKSIGNNSLIFKFLIPYMAALFIICTAIYILYFPQYKMRFISSNQYNASNISSEIENNISYLYGKINIFCSYLEKETNSDNLLNVFNNIIKNEPNLVNIFYADTIPYKDGGTVLNTLGSLPSDYDQTSREWYKNAITSKEIVISEPYIDIITKSIIVTFSKTIYVNGQLSGVVGIDVDFSKIISSALEEAKKYSYNINIINKEGLYIYNENQNSILKENIFNNKEISSHKNDIMNNNNYAWIDKKLSYISSKIKNTNWNIILSIENKELNLSLLKLLILII
ncbi:PDC sensor domain-containing protein, partial [Brachyspira hampsonii]